MKEKTNLKELFNQYLTGKASEGELLHLLDFFKLEEDSALLRALILAELEKEETLETTEEQQAILNRVSSVLAHGIRNEKVRLRKLYIRWSAAAAVVIIAGFWIGLERIQEGAGIFSSTRKEIIAPGQDKAILELEDGRIINLDSSIGPDAKNSYVFADTSGMMTFSSQDLPATDTKSAERTLRTPKGGQFAVLLSDGTKVWLNAESSISFPAIFAQRTRDVSITGEVYFEVTKNPTKPFLVHARQQTVKVLGTHFNINAYPENDAVQTSLLEGSVAVIAGGKQVQLLPGQMSVWQENQGGLQVGRIPDPENLLSWKEGMFCFDNNNIAEIMQVLARWYDIEFSFEKGDYSNCVFDAMIPKKKSIQEVLNILGASQQLEFKINGRKVIVSQAKSNRN
ncbi:FecR family protein [Sphingobacterium athyrii]|uniref:Anti-sigma factor n=1 Tax=Sphingobacterium athyrii TaxID=2152717 RepID=A0A363NPW8_9SPHI|nr:FecR family protein [Sphingobacterium athyrii]PUV22711.1 hypothetical protein DCO56_21180 [Sphingobacterium athyrii]